MEKFFYINHLEDQLLSFLSWCSYASQSIIFLMATAQTPLAEIRLALATKISYCHVFFSC